MPERLVVRRLVTIGSPAGHPQVHDVTRLLQSRLPANLRSWVNLYATSDPVTGFRGVSAIFPASLDLPVQLPGLVAHGSEAYLAQLPAASAVGEALFGSLSTEVALPTPAAVERSLDPVERGLLVWCRLAYEVQEGLKAGDPKSRFTKALHAKRRELDGLLRTNYVKDGRSAPHELLGIGDVDQPCALGTGWTPRLAAEVLARVYPAPLVPPYQIAVDPGCRREALEAVARRMDLTPTQATKLAKAAADVEGHLGTGGSSWWFYALGGTAALLLLAGPIGLAVAAPAGLSGAAAVTSALAAFGPGGMVGGVATAATLAAAGGASAASAYTSSSATSLLTGGEGDIASVVAAHLYRAAFLGALGERDETCTDWQALGDLERQATLILLQHEGLSDPKGPFVKAVTSRRELVRKAMSRLVEQRLGPGELSVNTTAAV